MGLLDCQYEPGPRDPEAANALRRFIGAWIRESGPAESDVPTDFALRQNHPNPFNPVTQIAFDLPEASNVLLTVYDVTGRAVAEIVNRQFEPGVHTVPFSADGLANGVYFYRLRAGDFEAIKKMVLLK